MMDNEECISKRFTAERLKFFKAANSEPGNYGGKFLLMKLWAYAECQTSILHVEYFFSVKSTV